MPGRRPAQSNVDLERTGLGGIARRIEFARGPVRIYFEPGRGARLTARFNLANKDRDMPERIRIAVVDDHPMFRAGVVFTLRAHPTWRL